MMTINQVAFAFVTFSSSTNGKKRPIIIQYADEHTIQFLSITSKYENKSDAIKKQYYPIQEWQEIGLSKKSWIDICSLREVEREYFSLEVIGELTTLDIKGLTNFIMEFNNKKS